MKVHRTQGKPPFFQDLGVEGRDQRRAVGVGLPHHSSLPKTMRWMPLSQPRSFILFFSLQLLCLLLGFTVGTAYAAYRKSIGLSPQQPHYRDGKHNPDYIHNDLEKELEQQQEDSAKETAATDSIEEVKKNEFRKKLKNRRRLDLERQSSELPQGVAVKWDKEAFEFRDEHRKRAAPENRSVNGRKQIELQVKKVQELRSMGPEFYHKLVQLEHEKEKEDFQRKKEEEERQRSEEIVEECSKKGKTRVLSGLEAVARKFIGDSRARHR